LTVITEEVDKRLEALFGEEDGTVKPVDGGEEFSLDGLKAAVLSIEWEITDEVMGRFIEEVVRLKGRYEEDKDLQFLFQLLTSVGNYIKAHKGKAHPDAVKVLNSVYGALERVVLDTDMAEGEKKGVLLEQLRKYKELKGRIAHRKGGGDKEKGAVALVGMKGMSPHEAFGYALEEIKQVIRAEFQALRAELKLWREGG